MKFIRFIRDILTEGSASGASSKRVAGMLGWLIALGVAIYCSISKNAGARNNRGYSLGFSLTIRLRQYNRDLEV